jgi:hypothetical protein
MDDKIAQAADRISQLEAELEASSDVTTAGASLVRVREILHRWVDSVTGVVATPGVGRVVLIHADGRESRIASPDLPLLLAEPVNWD